MELCYLTKCKKVRITVRDSGTAYLIYQKCIWVSGEKFIHCFWTVKDILKHNIFSHFFSVSFLKCNNISLIINSRKTQRNNKNMPWDWLFRQKLQTKVTSKYATDVPENILCANADWELCDWLGSEVLGTVIDIAFTK